MRKIPLVLRDGVEPPSPSYTGPETIASLLDASQLLAHLPRCCGGMGYPTRGP